MGLHSKVLVIVAALIIIGSALILLLSQLSGQMGISGELNILNHKGNKGMQITSPAFQNGGVIPVQFTCQGDNKSPELDFSKVPANTQTLVLIVDDPDAPGGTFVHWVLWNIPPESMRVPENGTVSGAENGLNGTGKIGYMGPCPPSGTHHYHFKLYALEKILHFNHTPTKAEVESAMKDYVLDQAELVGLYSKQ